MGDKVMFCEIITLVVSSLAPVDPELALAHSVANPVESHVNGIGAVLLHSVIGQPIGHFIVCGDWGVGLGMAQGLPECGA